MLRSVRKLCWVDHGPKPFRVFARTLNLYLRRGWGEDLVYLGGRSSLILLLISIWMLIMSKMFTQCCRQGWRRPSSSLWFPSTSSCWDRRLSRTGSRTWWSARCERALGGRYSQFNHRHHSSITIEIIKKPAVLVKSDFGSPKCTEGGVESPI